MVLNLMKQNGQHKTDAGSMRGFNSAVVKLTTVLATLLPERMLHKGHDRQSSVVKKKALAISLKKLGAKTK
jgi:hypothetical protein